MIRNWLRAWLGIIAVEQEHRCDLIKQDEAQRETWGRIENESKRLADQEKLTTEMLKLKGEMNAALQEVRQLREMVVDPKTIPVQTRNSRQFRALVEQEP